MKQLLITVGTTNFDLLITALDTEEFYLLLEKHGFTKLIMQIGNTGSYTPKAFENMSVKLKTLEVEVVKLVPKFEEVIKSSELVISHCGAGTILEGLKNKINLIIVINPTLMNNHQLELAEPLYKQNYILLVKNLKNILEELKGMLTGDFKLNSYPDFNYDVIPNLIYEMLDI